jgi:hypothetical protein
METAQNTSAATSPERRSHARLAVKLYGRFMLEDHSEHACAVIEISPKAVSLRADHIGNLGEKVIAYLDQVGRIEGIVTRTLDDGFALTLVASERKQEKLAAQLKWLNERQMSGMPEDRRHERIAPRNPVSVLHLMDGRKYECRIIDLSLSGAAIELGVKPALGSQVVLGTMRGQVVRHFDEGIAIEFASLQRAEALDSALGASAA